MTASTNSVTLGSFFALTGGFAAAMEAMVKIGLAIERVHVAGLTARHC